MSNAHLARHLIEITRELQQRKAGRVGRSNWSELDRALQEALPALEALVPKRERRTKRSTAAAAAPAIQEAKRKAIRTALKAGVSPGQVAKHFGLSLAAVRKVLTQAESG
jgi:DNA-directed RNA polymerase specialized sigma24 family protein